MSTLSIYVMVDLLSYFYSSSNYSLTLQNLCDKRFVTSLCLDHNSVIMQTHTQIIHFQSSWYIYLVIPYSSPKLKPVCTAARQFGLDRLIQLILFQKNRKCFCFVARFQVIYHLELEINIFQKIYTLYRVLLEWPEIGQYQLACPHQIGLLQHI